jgi:hypothetical protein
MRVPNPIRVNVIRRVEGADDSTGKCWLFDDRKILCLLTGYNLPPYTHPFHDHSYNLLGVSQDSRKRTVSGRSTHKVRSSHVESKNERSQRLRHAVLNME